MERLATGPRSSYQNSMGTGKVKMETINVDIDILNLMKRFFHDYDTENNRDSLKNDFVLYMTQTFDNWVSINRIIRYDIDIQKIESIFKSIIKIRLGEKPARYYVLYFDTEERIGNLYIDGGLFTTFYFPLSEKAKEKNNNISQYKVELGEKVEEENVVWNDYSPWDQKLKESLNKEPEDAWSIIAKKHKKE